MYVIKYTYIKNGTATEQQIQVKKSDLPAILDYICHNFKCREIHVQAS